MRKRNLRRARRLARQYAHFYPGDPNAWLILCDIKTLVGAHDEAEATLREGLQRHPDAKHYFELSGVLIRKGEEEEAHSLIRVLAKRYPDSVMSSIRLADMAWDEDNREAYEANALLALDRFEADPQQSAELAVDVAWKLYAMVDRREQAIDLLRRAAQRFPQEPVILTVLALLLEDSDEESSGRLLDDARKLMGAHFDFEERTEELRRLLRANCWPSHGVSP